MGPDQAGLNTDQEKRRRKSYSISDGDDQEQGETRGRFGLPRTWTVPNLCPQGETEARGKEASEEPVKALTIARKSVQEKSCTDSGLHLPVPLCYGTPG